MSTHPNAILALALKPDNTARKTFRAIMEELGLKDDDQIKIDGADYHVTVMEESYDDGYQISAAEGDIVLFDMVTYGYGEIIEWDKLEKQKIALAAWAEDICKRHQCTPKIFVTANYW